MQTQEKPTFENLINKSEIPILVDFHAEWCGPCHAMAPVLKDVAQAMHERVKIIKLDVDKNPGVSALYGIQGIPTVILFHNGKILWRHSGLMMRKELEEYLNKYIPKR